MANDFRWLCVDPGETVGWSVWRAKKLLGGGQTPLWEFAHDVDEALADGSMDPTSEDDPQGLLTVGDQPWLRAEPDENQGELGLIVCEKFALYPWKAKELAFDEFRTVQLIGALTFLAQKYDVRMHKQPADIKERAKQGGARELFVAPEHENRHQNDSILHGWFYVQVEMIGEPFQVRDGAQ